MYKYDHIDQTLVDQRVTQFRDQVERRLNGTLAEEEFRPLRLQNGLYHQRHAYMLRVAIPYGLLSAKQLRTLAFIADKYDRGYGHFTTRQNIQYNWVELEQTPDILAELAKVEMHAIQTSGNCIRNITSDAFAGVAADEYIDPRPVCEYSVSGQPSIPSLLICRANLSLQSMEPKKIALCCFATTLALNSRKTPQENWLQTFMLVAVWVARRFSAH